MTYNTFLQDFREPLINSSVGDKTLFNEVLSVYFNNVKWSPLRYFTIGGSMEMLIYAWIIKDFCWSQDLYYGGMIFGTLAVIIGLYCVILAAFVNNYYEVWQLIAQFLWLFANYWWMIGELYCSKFCDVDTSLDIYCQQDYSYYDKHSDEASVIFLVAIIWLSIYYVIIVPFSLLPLTKVADDLYNSLVDLPSPYPRLFSTWRSYENIHMIFWLCKDYSWIEMNLATWYLFLVPTLLLALDYVRLSSYKKSLFSEMLHYLAVMLWVCANIMWGICDFYHGNDDFPRTKGIPVLDFSATALDNYRWWASWIFLAALLPLALLFPVWWAVSLLA